MYSTFKTALISIVGMLIVLMAPACQEGVSPGTGGKPDQPTGARTNASVSGTVTYRERIALSPGATLEVQLRDVSLQDAASRLIAEQVIQNPGQVPIKFKIECNRNDLDPRNTYAVQARIQESDGRLAFINDTAYDVITRGNPDNVDMFLVRVNAPQWEEVPVSVVGARLLQPEPENLLMVTFHQSSIEGCSRPGGEEFEVDGSEIIVRVTRMAPPPDPSGIPCHEDLLELESIVRLGDSIVPGQTYRVTVNDRVTTAFTLPEPEFPDSFVESSPIERVEVVVLEGSPTHYELRVISGLPKGSACSIFNGYEIRRAGPTMIEVDVTHHEVADQFVICTADYPIVETSIPLGSDFEPGVEYSITVNSDTTETFVAH